MHVIITVRPPDNSGEVLCFTDVLQTFDLQARSTATLRLAAMLNFPFPNLYTRWKVQNLTSIFWLQSPLTCSGFETNQNTRHLNMIPMIGYVLPKYGVCHSNQHWGMSVRKSPAEKSPSYIINNSSLHWSILLKSSVLFLSRYCTPYSNRIFIT